MASSSGAAAIKPRNKKSKKVCSVENSLIIELVNEWIQYE